ncbi:MAG: hypothetical protein Q7S59_07085 [Sulfurimonas sp.]|nr:hypothetical protein [Sulfurimonas sp.]
MRFAKKVLLPLVLVSSLSAQDSWFVSVTHTNSFEAHTTRTLTPNDQIAAYVLSLQPIDKNVNTSHTLYGVRAGKLYDSWRVYADYDQFKHDKDKNDLADKNVDGWMVTANADYIYNIEVMKVLSFFAGAAVTLAGAKPEGMSSSPTPGVGGQAGIIVDVYKESDYKLSLEAGYRYLWLNIESTGTEQIPQTNSSIDIKTITSSLKEPYLSINFAF